MTGDLGTKHLHLERRGPLAYLRIDRPEARNALTPAMYAGIGRAIGIANRDPAVGALIITGTGDAFIPGGDLSQPDDVPGDDRLSVVLPWPLFRSSRVPIVAAINGICFASGVMVALLSDVAVASDRATFRIPELARGFPDMWMAAVLPAHVGVGRARELALTNRRVNAEEARSIGIVERVVAHEDLETEAELVTLEVLASAPEARNRFRHALNARYGVVDEMAMDWATSSDEAAEGFAAFIEKREPSWSPSSEQGSAGAVRPT